MLGCAHTLLPCTYDLIAQPHRRMLFVLGILPPCKYETSTLRGRYSAAAPLAAVGPWEVLLHHRPQAKPPQRLVDCLYLPGRPSVQTGLHRCILKRSGSA